MQAISRVFLSLLLMLGCMDTLHAAENIMAGPRARTSQINATMSGTLTVSPSCVIPAGASRCSVNVSWSTINPVGVSAVTSNTPSANTQIASGNNGSTTASVFFNSRTFFLYNNAVQLAASSATSSCTSGTSWNGSICQVTVITFLANPPTITTGQSSMLSWTTTNVASVTISGVAGTLPASGSILVNPTVNTTYTLTAVGSGGIATRTTQVLVGDACPWTIPSMPVDSESRLFEDAAKGPDVCAALSESLVPPSVDEVLSADVDSLAKSFPSGTVSRVSGYRPSTYQDHLHDVKLRHDSLVQSPNKAANCTELANWVKAEIIKHCLKTHTTDSLLAVEGQSSHTLNPSRALDLRIDPSIVVSSTVLSRFGLARCTTDSAFHVQLSTDPNPCKRPQSVVATASLSSSTSGAKASSSLGTIRLLLTDPSGRRIGYDPLNGTVVNDFASNAAEYSGDDSTNPSIRIADAGSGIYRLTAVGAGSGAYELIFQSIDADTGEVVSEQKTLGSNASDIPTTPVSIPVQVETSPTSSPSRHRGVAHP